MQETFDQMPLTSYLISFLSDDVIRMRYVEIESQLRKLIMVVKMRGAPHSKDIREYDISSEGLVIGERLADYVDLLTGVPRPLSASNDSDRTRSRKNKKKV